jgi:hypothetical protein
VIRVIDQCWRQERRDTGWCTSTREAQGYFGTWNLCWIQRDPYGAAVTAGRALIFRGVQSAKRHHRPIDH